MNQSNITWISGTVVEDEIYMTIVELCQAASTPEDLIMDWVSEGVLSPSGSSPQDWRFGGESLRRAKTAARLARDLELNTPGVALALDLLDEITSLRAHIHREKIS